MTNSTFILIHGAWHDSRCWQKVAASLEQRGHKVLTPDLPGTGKNPADPARTSLKAYSRYISQLINNKDNIILVGHSMSGVLIAQLAELLTPKIKRLVFLCAYVPSHGESLFSLIEKIRDNNQPFAIEAAMQLSQDKMTFTLLRSNAIPLLYNCCPAQEAHQLAEQLIAQPTLPFRGKVSLTDNKFGNCPKTYICALQDQVIPVKIQRKMASAAAVDEYLQMDCDHSPFHSSPNELAGLLHSLAQS